MKKMWWKKMGIGVLVMLQQWACAAQISDLRLPAPGPRPDLRFDCAGGLPVKASARRTKAAASVKAVNNILMKASSPYANHVFALAGDDVMWWLEITRSIDLGNLGTAIHEAGHTLDAALRNCQAGQSAYYLDGRVWNTGLKFVGETPPLSIAKDLIPDHIRETSGRYKTYVDTKSNNELSVLLEEMVAYAGAAELEIALVGSPLYKEQFAVYDTIDANLGGTADFMFFLTSYLRALRTSTPDTWQKLRDNPALLAFVQHLWDKCEFLLGERQRLHLNAYVVSQEVVTLTYRPEFIGELDRLGLHHLPQSPLQ